MEQHNRRPPLLLISAIILIVFGIYLSFEYHKRQQDDEAGNLRIVSLMPSLTQSLYYLDAQKSLVGCTSYCLAAKADDIECVSSVLKPNLEKIATLRPNLVLASGMTPQRDVETLRKLDVRVEQFDSPKSFEQILSEFLRLGEMVGRAERAREIIGQTRAHLRLLALSDTMQTKPKIFFQIGASPIYAVIPGTFMDDYITLCGGTNIARELSSGIVGREFVVSRDPDYIFIVTMGIAAEEQANQWRQFEQMSAVKNDRIYILDSDVACLPTPVTFVQTLEMMREVVR
ncbi:Vitamin B12 ABC transporter BtuF [Mucinivorans hirudinis]|uniref:Vitamin B12 ABC transporter BtuF n=1 Tax=Mucinivorans hirudinis TaxID=1433126 RepID=A0A060RA63_9BACT|nr:Vitamin B12 ABC transporter BtuF [Mucinivorans hirudinis]